MQDQDLPDFNKKLDFMENYLVNLDQYSPEQINEIKHKFSYVKSEFCSRIQDIRAILMSKVNQNSSLSLREAKRVIYNNTSLNVFLYNLPEHMVRIVRIKNPDSLEAALKHVLEEVNFQEEYNLSSKMLQHRPQSLLLPS